MRENDWGSNFDKVGGFWRDEQKLWQKLRYGFYPCGLFDLLYNTCRKIIDDKDFSPWAYEALERCADLLSRGIRYPGIEQMAKNRVGLRISKILYRLRLVKHQKYGPNTKLTRDPYCYFFIACVVLDRRQFIQAIKVPWYLYAPHFWAWKRYLDNPTAKNKKKWLRLERMNHPKKDYAVRMQRYRKLYTEQLNEG